MKVKISVWKNDRPVLKDDWKLVPTDKVGTVVSFGIIHHEDGDTMDGAYVQIGNKIEAFSLDQLEVIENATQEND